MRRLSRVSAAVVLVLLHAGNAGGQERPPFLDASPHRVQFVTVEDGIRLEVLDWGGTGRPIVLLAGLGNTAHVFDEFALRLREHGHVYGITRRGYGASTVAASGYTADRLGEDVVRVLDSLRLERPVLIGHSIAGQELSHLASRHAERIAGVIYVDAAYRYAYYRPGVRENLTELRRKLEVLDAELNKGPRNPAEMVATLRTVLGNTLEEFQRDVQELMTPPPALPPSPRPSPADLKDFAAFRSWSARVRGFAPPEAELRHAYAVTAGGGVDTVRKASAVQQAITVGAQRYTDIRVPALAIFASPHDAGPWLTENPAHRTAAEAFARFDEAMTERQALAFERGVPGARVVRLRGAHHYVFLSHESNVLKEVAAFLAMLR